MTQILIVVPARSGSKGLVGKNIKLMQGHPLLSYSVAAGLQIEQCARVVCSTDSIEIADIAKFYGAEVPFLRPVELAQDDSTDLELFQNLIEWMTKNGETIPEVIVQLRPTSPIRFKGQIEAAIKMLCDDPLSDSVRAVVSPTPANPFKMWRKSSKGVLTNLLEVPGLQEPYNMPRQELPEVWFQTGTLDVVRTSVITEKSSMSGEVILGYEVDPRYSIDIDGLDDFERCEKIMSGINCITP